MSDLCPSCGANLENWQEVFGEPHSCVPKVVWLKARCSECGMPYEYPEGGYKPTTCKKFDCIRAHLHPRLKKRRL